MSSTLRTYLFAVFLFGFGFTLCATAQESPAAPASATSSEIVEWLSGSDSRMIAWGAYFAVENHDATIVPYLQRLAEQWQPTLGPRYNSDGSLVKKSDANNDRERAMFGVLDALIQLHASVAPEAIQTLATDFNEQALTLFAYLPEAQRRSLAQSIYAGRLPGANYFWLGTARQQMPRFNADRRPSVLPGFNDFMEQYAAGDLIHVAAAILASNPPPGFAASLLNETTVLLSVSVGAKAPSGISGGMCGDSFALGPPKGWPAEWTYVVETLLPVQKQAGIEVIVPGFPAITTRRARSASSCSSIYPFSSSDRTALLAGMIAPRNPKLGWGLHDWEDVEYTDDLAFQAAVQRAVLQREQAYQATAAALLAKGWLTPAEAETARPTLEVEIRDARADKTRELPQVPLAFAKTRIVPAGKP